MLFERILKSRAEARPAAAELLVGSRRVPLVLVRHPRARRYLLRLRPDGSARVTIPRGGSAAAAKEFASRHTGWLEQQLERLQTQPRGPAAWQAGTEVLFRGEPVRIEVREPGRVALGPETLRVADTAADLRPEIEQHLRRLATQELPPRVLELAAGLGVAVRRVTIRSQRTRWGSCSRRSTISLNWRLIQTPAFVRDYLCLHELVHLREMNHSARFWREVERVCPDYAQAERWLKAHSRLLQ